MDLPPILGITGKARSGKDTAAAILAHELGYQRLAFADALRDVLDLLIPIPDKYKGPLKEQPIPLLGKSYRELLQTLGTEWGRCMVGPGFWITVLANAWHTDHASAPIVIPDIRFDNEAQWVRLQGGNLLHLERPDAPQIRRHVSEMGVTRMEGEPVISADTLESLEQQVHAYCDSLRFKLTQNV